MSRINTFLLIRLLALVGGLYLGPTASAWEPVWEVAHLPFRIKIEHHSEEDKKLGLTETMMRDAVELRFRANNVPTFPDLTGFAPYVELGTLSLRAEDPGGTSVIFYNLWLRVRKPRIVQCISPSEGAMLSLEVWGSQYVGMARYPDYARSVQNILVEMADEFSLVYHRASEQVPIREMVADQLEHNFQCQKDE